MRCKFGSLSNENHKFMEKYLLTLKLRDYLTISSMVHSSEAEGSPCGDVLLIDHVSRLQAGQDVLHLCLKAHCGKIAL